MQSHLIDFNSVSWLETGEGVRLKAFRKGTQQIRLVEFSEGFFEKDWCKKAHSGYVIEGSCSTDFNGTIENFNKGDVIYIPEGEEDKHKMIINDGEKVLLLLFETV